MKTIKRLLVNKGLSVEPLLDYLLKDYLTATKEA